MGFLDKLLRRGQRPAADQAAVAEQECPHVALVPRWDSADDMGKTELVSRYVCEACNATFSREEGEAMQAEEAERLRSTEIERLKESESPPD